jgi:hypothetical protein
MLYFDSKQEGDFLRRSGHTLRMGHNIPAGRGSISMSDREFSNKAKKLSRIAYEAADSESSLCDGSWSSV